MPIRDTMPLSAVLPADMRVNPLHLRRYIEALGANGCHSVMVLRHGVVIAKAWWRPYREEYGHILFSVSKSFVSVAVGMAVDEGLLSLDEKLVDIFADLYPCLPCEHMRKVTVRHLLTMSMGHRGKTDLDFIAADDWLEECLQLYLEKEPGTDFSYDNRCTYICGVILQRRSGMTVYEYLRERLFARIGIHGASWELSPAGYVAGGWGLRATTESMARFGQFLLQKGMWNGEQLLSSGYLAEATANHIDTRGKSILASEQCWHGYGYFFWQSPFPGAFRADGALGQCVIVMPEQDMVIAMTAGTATRNTLLEATWRELCPGVDAVDADHGQEQRKLEQAMENLAIPPASLGTDPARKSGKPFAREFRVADNRLGITHISLEAGEADVLSMRIDGIKFRVKAGHGGWIDNETAFSPEGGSDVRRVFHHRVAASSAWDGDTVLIKLAYVNTPFIDEVRLKFHSSAIEGVYSCRPFFGARGGDCALLGVTL